MKIYVTRQDKEQAQYLCRQEYDDTRRYYEVYGALLVLRDGNSMTHLVGQVVDATIGWDIAQPGFTLNENKIGTKRTKITIYRPLYTPSGKWKYPSLKQQIERRKK